MSYQYKKRYLIPIITALSISLVACQEPITPPIVPSPIETSGPVVTNPVLSELTLKIKGDQSLQNFIISQSKGLCLNDITAFKTQIKLPFPLDESKKSLLALKGITVEDDILTTQTNISDLSMLLAGLEITFPEVPNGELKVTTLLLDKADNILGRLKYELELESQGGTVSIFLKPVDKASSEPNCPVITVDIEGAVITEASEGILLPIKPEKIEEPEIEPSPSPSPEPTPTPEPSPTPTPEADLVEPPGDLKIVSRSTETLTAHWTFKEDEPHTYTLFLDGKVFKRGLENNSFTFADLSPDTEYTVEIQTITADGESIKVNIKTTTTSSGKEGSGNFGGGGDIAPESSPTPTPTPSPSVSPTPTPSATPIGEFQVNSELASEQVRADIASDDNGNFVVVWDSNLQDGSGRGIYGQRYNAQGTPQGSEFLVNTTTAGDQEIAAVAMDSDGDFVVTWTGQDDDDKGIFAQRFMADGTPDGAEFQVNTTTEGVQTNSDVAMDDLGNFVVTWSGDYYYGGQEIYGRKYTAAGTPQTGEISIFNSTDTSINHSSVAMDNDGDFVVAWQSIYNNDRSVNAQRYNSIGNTVGSQIDVTDNYTASSPGDPSVALDDSGKFIVTWHDSGHLDSSNSGIYARRYDSGGSPVATEFLVNTTTASSQSSPDIGLDASGNFVVTWHSNLQDGDSTGIIGQRYDSNATPLGSEFQINTFTSNTQHRSSVAVNNNGSFVVSWESPHLNGTYEIEGRIYDANGDSL